MTKSFKGKNAKICVAVKFDDISRLSVRIAEQFCKRTGAQIHLVHICDNLLTNNMASIVSNNLAPIPAEILQMALDNVLEDAESKMKAFCKDLNLADKVTTSVMGSIPGTPTELIEAEALSKQCSMIVVGTSPGSHRFIPRGFSCALSLMSNSKLPVMVVNNNQSVELDSQRLQMVIADDLKNHSAAAVVGGCEIGFALGKTDIHHIHINGMTVPALKSALDAAFATSRTRPDPAVSADVVYDLTMKQLEHKLESRAAGKNVSLELTGCRYFKELLTDNSVTEGLKNFVGEKKANLVVFGRHQTFHRKPFNIGQMPYYAMLELGCPVIVFPSNEN